MASPFLIAPPITGRRYRFIDARGRPHPVLDETFDNLDQAWQEAIRTLGPECDLHAELGLEVSTPCGSWRTLRHASGLMV